MKKTLKFNGIQNESQLNHITDTAEDCGCLIKMGPFCESVEVIGTLAQLENFRKKYES